jgi:hypothetical protein
MVGVQAGRLQKLNNRAVPIVATASYYTTILLGTQTLMHVYAHNARFAHLPPRCGRMWYFTQDS